MNNLRSMILVVAGVLLSAGAIHFTPSIAQETTQSDEQEPKTDRQQFMRGKLKMVQKIVEGIATEDFDLVKSGGMELAAISESATWKSTKDPYYKQYSANFEHATRGLIEAAKSESVEKATFAYVHVTISCTACHQHVRSTVRVAAGTHPLAGDVGKTNFRSTAD